MRRPARLKHHQWVSVLRRRYRQKFIIDPAMIQSVLTVLVPLIRRINSNEYDGLAPADLENLKLENSGTLTRFCRVRLGLILARPSR